MGACCLAMSITNALGHVFPRLTRANLVDDSLAHSVLDGKRAGELPRGSNGSDVVLCDECSRIAFADIVSSPAFCYAISNVVSLCAKEQMIRVDAKRSVATMANLHAVWNWAVGDLPRHARRALDVTVPLKIAIAFSGQRRGPIPAIVRSFLRHLRPEAIDLRRWHSATTARRRTKGSSWFLDRLSAIRAWGTWLESCGHALFYFG